MPGGIRSHFACPCGERRYIVCGDAHHNRPECLETRLQHAITRPLGRAHRGEGGGDEREYDGLVSPERSQSKSGAVHGGQVEVGGFIAGADDGGVLQRSLCATLYGSLAGCSGGGNG